MSDRLATILVAVFRPYEKLWGWHIRRQYRRGKFKRPYGDPRELGSTGAVTTKVTAS